MSTPTISSIANAAPDNAARKPLFPAELPVSYDTTGNVASRFGDLIWDLTSMSTDGTSTKNLHFYKTEPSADPNLGWLLREQHKALMWLHMDAGKERSWSALLNTNLALHICSKEAAARGVDLYSLLANSDWLLETAQGLNKVYMSMLSSALQTLWRHREQLRGPIDIPLQSLQLVLSEEAKRRPEDQQTPLIPSRVYCAILAALGERLSVIENELGALLNAYVKDRKAWKNAQKGRSLRSVSREKTLSNTAKPMEKLGYKSTTLSQFIAKRLNQHKVTLMLVIAAYSGMRVGEVGILPLRGTLVEFEHMGFKHYELHGSTHKLNKGVKRSTTWITSSQGARAVRLAQRIARTIKQQHGEAPKASQQALLFPSNMNCFRALSRESFFVAMTALRTDICPVIEASDIEELDQLELARDWARDEIVVGVRWPLAFHQLRRSLAVYAHRSGMVSLPALKAQLQHITQEMTSYYSDGFSRAVNLVFDKTHFSHEWKAAKAESSYFAYILGVLFSDEELLGQGAQRMANAVTSRNRQDTLRLFKQNKLAYRETPLGGCASTEDCKTEPLEPIPYDCLESNCVNLVVFGKRLEHIIKHQEVTVATLANDEAGSVEHRLEASHLEMLLKARRRLKKGVV